MDWKSFNIFSSSQKNPLSDKAILRMRDRALRNSRVDVSTLPKPIFYPDNKRIVNVYVEGYDDVAFWRAVFDHFTNPFLRFEISVPPQRDLPKGKKVLLSMVEKSSPYTLLCMDSDFDYLFNGQNEISTLINSSPYMFHTYAYATENYLCYAPSLHNVCCKATKNDTHIFDFKFFMTEYSKIIYPAFLWYSFSAFKGTPNVFSLTNFRNAVRIGYLDISGNGVNTLAWLGRHVKECVSQLEQENPEYAASIPKFQEFLSYRGVEPQNTYLFMQGHTLMDNVVLVILSDVCEKLRQMSLMKIVESSKQGEALDNEIKNYNNSLRSIREVLLDNENYTDCPLYLKLKEDIQAFIDRTIAQIVCENSQK